MLRAHLVIMGGAVLQEVAVAILAVLFPLRRHLCRGLHEVVLSVEVIGVVGLVYLANVVQKAFERLSIAVLIEQ